MPLDHRGDERVDDLAELLAQVFVHQRTVLVESRRRVAHGHLAIDDAGAEQKVRDFVKEFGITFDVVHDPAGQIQKTYATTGVPENFVIGADGTVRKKAYAQDWNSPENRALIARLLDEAGAR